MKYDDPKILAWMKTATREDTCPFIVCQICNKSITTKTKHLIQIALSPSRRLKRPNIEIICCSSSCAIKLNKKNNPSKLVACSYCGNTILREASQIKKYDNSFCSSSCSAIYNNTHKTIGIRRSKLETWLEQQLVNLYPNLTIHFNKKDAIQSELDIYIPSLKLAFELNGIFHYEPIYGTDKLTSILNNDNRKFQACLEHGIELCIIDSSKQKRFTEQSSKQYLDIITTIINHKLSNII